jgi:hypothetical protein
MLQKEYQYFLDHKEEFKTKYNNRFVVIVGESIVGDYGSEDEAYVASSKKYPLGTFLIQLVDAKGESTTQTFFSRVAFA